MKTTRTDYMTHIAIKFVFKMSSLTLCLLVSTADNLCKQFVNKMSGLIWIQTVWHSDGIPVRIFQKVDFEINQQTAKKHSKLPIMAKS